MLISRKFCNTFFCSEGEKAFAVPHRPANRKEKESFMVLRLTTTSNEVQVVSVRCGLTCEML